MKKPLLLAIILIIGLVLSACGNGPEKEKTGKGVLTIYTTVYPLQYFTERIGGQHVNVHSIYPPGADEHSFEPSQKDMMALADSDLFIYVGLGLEGFVEKAKSALQNEDVKLVAAGKDISKEDLSFGTGEEHLEEGENHGNVDPHVWLDPVNAKYLASAIEDALSKKQPNNRAEFEKNYNELIAELDDLDKKFKDTAASAKNKEIIVSHAAFGYWEKRYGILQIPIAGMSTTSEPTQKDMEKIISIVKNHNIPYILVEQNVNSKLAKTVQAETNTELLKVHNLAVLTAKNLKDKETYFTLMNKNLDTLKKAMN